MTRTMADQRKQDRYLTGGQTETGGSTMRYDYSDILAGVREGRLTAESARRMMEQRQQDTRAAERRVTAHSHRQALRDAHLALDRGHPGNYADSDEFAKLFPPSSPIGPPDDDEDLKGQQSHYSPPSRQQVFDRQHRAAAYDSDEDDWAYTSLYGRDGRTYQRTED